MCIRDRHAFPAERTQYRHQGNRRIQRLAGLPWKLGDVDRSHFLSKKRILLISAPAAVLPVTVFVRDFPSLATTSFIDVVTFPAFLFTTSKVKSSIFFIETVSRSGSPEIGLSCPPNFAMTSQCVVVLSALTRST